MKKLLGLVLLSCMLFAFMPKADQPDSIISHKSFRGDQETQMIYIKGEASKSVLNALLEATDQKRKNKGIYKLKSLDVKGLEQDIVLQVHDGVLFNEEACANKPKSCEPKNCCAEKSKCSGESFGFMTFTSNKMKANILEKMDEEKDTRALMIYVFETGMGKKYATLSDAENEALVAYLNDLTSL